MGSISGTEPGFPLPGGLVTLPLNWDAVSNLVLMNMNRPCFLNFLGFLDGSGNGTAELNSNGPIDPVFVGTVMHFAFGLYNPFDFVSNPVAIEITPY